MAGGFVDHETPKEFVAIVQECRTIIIINICMFAAATISGALRIYVRVKLLHLFGSDDWAMLVAQIARLGFSTYIASIIVIKVSVALFMRRIFGHHHPRERAAVYLFTAIPFMVGTALIIMTGSTCAYDFKDFSTSVCSVSSAFNILNQVFSVSNCVSDIFFAGLAFSVLWKMTMTRAARLSAGFLFAVGATGGVASVMRVVSFYQGGSDTSEQLHYTRWSVIEAGTCATAACLFTLRPLFRQGFAWRLGNHLFASNPEKNPSLVPVIPEDHVANLQTHGLAGNERKQISLLMSIKERSGSVFSGPSHATLVHSCSQSFAGTLNEV
ncbi:hypothetical protein ANO11243_082770 [Dothideomycetidae sp. 11243]|nr:hypothetical protein ANO11243_082770 [fungal sp. No.11243]